jgi:hypothetical protein
VDSACADFNRYNQKPVAGRMQGMVLSIDDDRVAAHRLGSSCAVQPDEPDEVEPKD